MKNNLLKYYILAFYLFSSFVLFAQDPGTTGNGEGGLEGESAVSNPGTTGNGDGGLEGGAAVPIDTYLWILALVAVLYVFFKYRGIQNKRIQS